MSNIQINDNKMKNTSYYLTKDGRKIPSSVLHKLAEGLPSFDLPITEDIITSKLHWIKENVWDIVVHLRKVENADLYYPIILNSKGSIIDGWHRVVKSVINDYETIKAVQLTKKLEERIDHGSKI